jgi:NAD(P)-dependent dehydrogenase (short-subunit alcohol dehydrogenase family)
MELDGKVALVTGGSNGIGEGVARYLAAQGAHVVLADIDDDRGAQVAQELGGRFIHTDVSEPADSAAAVAFAVA